MDRSTENTEEKITNAKKKTIYDLPQECLLEILKKLPYYDALRFRQTCFFVGDIYYKFIKHMQGRKLEIFINIRDDQLKFDDAVEVDERYWLNVLTNATVVLHIRLGANSLSDENVKKIHKIFSKSAMESVFLYARFAQQSMFTLLNLMNVENSNISVGELELKNITKFYPQINSLKIGARMAFFHFNDLMSIHPGLQYLTMRMSFASGNALGECVNQWTRGERQITDWQIYIPIQNMSEMEVYTPDTSLRSTMDIWNADDTAFLTISTEIHSVNYKTEYLKLQISKCPWKITRYPLYYTLYH